MCLCSYVVNERLADKEGYSVLRDLTGFASVAFKACTLTVINAIRMARTPAAAKTNRRRAFILRPTFGPSGAGLVTPNCELKRSPGIHLEALR